MPVSTSERRKYLENLRSKQPKYQKRIHYKGDSVMMGVYDIDLNCLIFNQHNGRLESEMLTWQAETGAPSGEYTQEVHERIARFLWEQNASKNRQTQEDLDAKGQQLPGIVTLDGVIIDGNRRAMLLGKLEKAFFEGVILPDAYAENEAAIVELETQYQLGEDEKLGYGPLEKYLHAKRLHRLGVSEKRAYKLMSLQGPAEFQKLLDIMKLMDEYLEHIDCAGLYKLLKESDGSTKEGMFVDLYSDLKRFGGEGAASNWAHDEIDLIDLKVIQFDHIRYGNEFSDDGKDYRRISHSGAEKKNCFFAHEEIWKSFREVHEESKKSAEADVGTLDEFVKNYKNDYSTRSDAARAWINQWKDAIGPGVKKNFGVSKELLTERSGETEPNRLLWRALRAIEGIPLEEGELTAKEENLELVKKINNRTYKMKKLFERRK